MPRDEWALIRGTDPDRFRLMLAPQLVLHLDRIFSAQSKLEARLQYAPWTSLMQRPGRAEWLPQAVLRLPF